MRKHARRLLGRLLVRAPRMVFAVSDLLAPFVSAGLDRTNLARVFPELAHGRAAQADRWSRRVLLRNRVLIAALRLHGYDARLARLTLPQPLLATLRPPAIITTFHIGALTMLGFALAQLPAKVLILRAAGSGTPHPAFEHAATRVTEQERALLFRRCVDFLRAGGFVFMAADPRPAKAGSLSVPFRGSKITLARGPFALSRITRAPLIPLVARWRGTSVEYILGEPVLPAQDENDMAAALTAWLDRYLTAEPLEISEQTLDLIR